MHLQHTRGQHLPCHEVLEVYPQRVLQCCPLGRLLMVFVDVELNQQFCMSDGLLLFVWGELVEAILWVLTIAMLLSEWLGCYLWRR